MFALHCGFSWLRTPGRRVPHAIAGIKRMARNRRYPKGRPDAGSSRRIVGFAMPGLSYY